MTVTTELDSIYRRQTARFLDHLRETNQITPTLETDYLRSMRYTFKDVKRAVENNSPEAGSHDPERHETR